MFKIILITNVNIILNIIEKLALNFCLKSNPKISN
jgi:hypothetical protein